MLEVCSEVHSGIIPLAGLFSVLTANTPSYIRSIAQLPRGRSVKVRSWSETHQENGNVGPSRLTCADRLGAESQTVHIYGCHAEGRSDPCGKLNLNRLVAARTGGSTFLVVSSAEEAVFINA
jgi:hypothetical protein